MKYRVKVNNFFKNQIGGDPQSLLRSASTGTVLKSGNTDRPISGNTDDIFRLQRKIYNLNEQLTVQAKEIARLSRKLSEAKTKNEENIKLIKQKFQENIKLIKQKFQVTDCLDVGPPGQKSTEGWGTRHDINCKLATDHAGSPLQNPKIKEILYSRKEINEADQYIEDKRLIEFVKLLEETKENINPVLQRDFKLAQQRLRSRKQQDILYNELSDIYEPSKN